MYDVVNTAHPLREDNERTQRLFLADLATGACYRIDWTRIPGEMDDTTSRLAREGNTDPMRAMFAEITHETEERAVARASTP